MTMKMKRKRYSPLDKVLIIKKHLVEQVPLSDICDQYNLHPTVYYRWQKDFFENGEKAFHKGNNSEISTLTARITNLENKISQKNEVISELMEEHVSLKKNLGVI